MKKPLLKPVSALETRALVLTLLEAHIKLVMKIENRKEDDVRKEIMTSYENLLSAEEES